MTSVGPTTYTYSRATVLSVTDGDTVELSIDLGFSISTHFKRVRLAGINAPEMKTPQGPLAKAHLEQLLGPLPATVSVQTFLDREDNYGRVLVRILQADGTSLNNRMLKEGYAVELGPLAA